MANTLIFGASGQVGSALMRSLWNRVDGDVVGTCFTHPSNDYEVVDISSKIDVDNIVRAVKPKTIYIAAYNSNANECEFVAQARHTNINGIFNILEAAKLIRAKVIFFSSSYVFDGTKDEAYTTYDLPAPIQQYGVQKVIGENAVLSSSQYNVVIRTVGVFGVETARKNFAFQVLDKLTAGMKVYAPDNQEINPINNVQLAGASVALVESGFSGLAHIAGSERVSKYRFAKDIANEFGFNRNDVVVDNNSLGKALRPRNGCLKSNFYCDYVDGLRMFYDSQK